MKDLPGNTKLHGETSDTSLLRTEQIKASTLITFIQSFLEDLDRKMKQDKEINGTVKRRKLFLFAKDMMINTENTRKPNKKLI